MMRLGNVRECGESDLKGRVAGIRFTRGSTSTLAREWADRPTALVWALRHSPLSCILQHPFSVLDYDGSKLLRSLSQPPHSAHFFFIAWKLGRLGEDVPRCRHVAFDLCLFRYPRNGPRHVLPTQSFSQKPAFGRQIRTEGGPRWGGVV